MKLAMTTGGAAPNISLRVLGLLQRGVVGFQVPFDTMMGDLNFGNITKLTLQMINQ